MRKVKVCVTYNVIVEVDWDDSLQSGMYYFDNKIAGAKGLADKVMEASPPKPKITNAEVWGMLE